MSETQTMFRRVYIFGVEEVPRYGWFISQDHLAEEGEESEVGIMGPSEVAEDEHADLLAAIEMVKAKREIPAEFQAAHFSMYDDDGERYYSGYLVWPDGEEPDEDRLVAPLTDFGRPNAGAVLIKYRGKPEWTCEG